MTQRRWILLAAGQGLLIAALLLMQFRQVPVIPGTGAVDPADDGPTAARPAAGGQASAAAIATAPLTVHLAPEVVAASGIRSAALQGARVAEAVADWAEVVAVTPLTEARQRLQQADAELAQWPPQLAAARQEHARVDALFREGGSVALRVVEQAATALQLAEQRARVAQQARDALLATVQAEFGRPVAEALASPTGGALAGLLQGDQRLLLVASAATASATRGRVLPADGLSPGMPARRFAPAVHALGATGLPSWYWLSPAVNLRVGQRVRLVAVAAGVPDAQTVLLPEGAVVWQSGAAWIWQALPGAVFARRSVPLGAPVPGGWLVQGVFRPGERVVVEGAQLLLSEESRAQIRNENGD